MCIYCIYIYMNIYTYTHIHIYTYTCTYTYTHVYTIIYIYIYIYTHIHICVHIYIYIYYRYDAYHILKLCMHSKVFVSSFVCSRAIHAHTRVRAQVRLIGRPPRRSSMWNHNCLTIETSDALFHASLSPKGGSEKGDPTNKTLKHRYYTTFEWPGNMYFSDPLQLPDLCLLLVSARAPEERLLYSTTLPTASAVPLGAQQTGTNRGDKSGGKRRNRWKPAQTNDVLPNEPSSGLNFMSRLNFGALYANEHMRLYLRNEASQACNVIIHN